jgi:hypothetical protein
VASELGRTGRSWLAALVWLRDSWSQWPQRAFVRVRSQRTARIEKPRFALLNEVSILSPAKKPAKPNALVLSLGIAHREAAEQTIDISGATIRRSYRAPLTVR